MRVSKKGAQAAEFEPKSLDAEAGTVDVVWTTSAPVVRFGGYYERLSDSSPDLTRFNSGASVLDNHKNDGVMSIIGAVVPGSASFSGGRGKATLRFDLADPNAADVFGKVQRGFARGVSFGYLTNRAKVSKESINGLPVVDVLKYEPQEISICPIQADLGASVRSGDVSDSLDLETEMYKEEKIVMPPAAVRAAENAGVDAAESAVKAERTRVTEIVGLAEGIGIPAVSTRADEMVASGTPLESALPALRSIWAEHKRASQISAPASSGSSVEYSDDVRMQKRNAAIEEALMNRVDAKRNKLSSDAREFRGLSLARMGGMLSDVRGWERAADAELTLELFGKRAMSSSDFPAILANVANKTLLQAYSEMVSEWGDFVRETTAKDFKIIQRTALSSVADLQVKPENGPYAYTQLQDAKETFGLVEYGEIVPIGSQLIMNDDMGAFQRVIPGLGRAAKRAENVGFFSVLTQNANMADNLALFVAGHANLNTGAGSALSRTSLSKMFVDMRKQQGLKSPGTSAAALQPMGVSPSVIFVPDALRDTAWTLLDAPAASAPTGGAQDAHMYRGKVRTVSSPLLDVNSTTKWYGMASYNDVDTVELCKLDGRPEPIITQSVDWKTDALELKVNHVFAFKAIDYRGMYRHDGA